MSHELVPSRVTHCVALVVVPHPPMGLESGRWAGAPLSVVKCEGLTTIWFVCEWVRSLFPGGGADLRHGLHGDPPRYLLRR